MSDDKTNQVNELRDRIALMEPVVSRVLHWAMCRENAHMWLQHELKERGATCHDMWKAEEGEKKALDALFQAIQRYKQDLGLVVVRIQATGPRTGESR